MAGTLVVMSMMAACGKPSGQSAPTSGSAAVAKPAVPAGEQPYTLALVYCGGEIWNGNDQLPTDVLPKDDPTRYPGAFTAIKDAVAKADLAHKAPAGSQAMIVTYADDVKVRAPLGPIASFTPETLGSQKDYFGFKGVQLALGVATALDQLEKAPTANKRLIVLSDGNDTNNEGAKGQFALLKKRAAAANIAVTSLVFKSEYSSDGDITGALTDHSKVEPTSVALGADLLQALQHPGA